MTRAERTRNIAQGEYAVGTHPEDVITTLLGSCVGVCLHDPVNGVGGMNHILLPDDLGATATSASIGINAMELLINALIKSGAAREHLCAKIFGGSSMIEGLSSIGPRNAEFAERFLSDEGIPILNRSTGGSEGRRIRFWPHSGAARQKMLGAAILPEQVKAPVAAPPAEMNGVELF